VGGRDDPVSRFRVKDAPRWRGSQIELQFGRSKDSTQFNERLRFTTFGPGEKLKETAFHVGFGLMRFVQMVGIHELVHPLHLSGSVGFAVDLHPVPAACSNWVFLVQFKEQINVVAPIYNEGQAK
jgi:hypothetical protein